MESFFILVNSHFFMIKYPLFIPLIFWEPMLMLSCPLVQKNTKWRKDCKLEIDFAWHWYPAWTYETTTCIHILQCCAKWQKRSGEDDRPCRGSVSLIIFLTYFQICKKIKLFFFLFPFFVVIRHIHILHLFSLAPEHFWVVQVL